jgi:hypothetical protein
MKYRKTDRGLLGQKILRNGVASPENPSIDDISKIYGLIYSNDTELNKEIFKEYAKTIKPSVDSLVE